MRYLFLLIVLITTKLNAQSDLKFDKRFVESEDKWVVFQKSEDNLYPYGFIYIDSEAGLTLNYEGTFKISPIGEFIPTKLDSTNMKIRLEPNNVLVAFIPKNKFAELKINSIPDWLKYYKTDENTIERLYNWGYMYNGWNECEKALTFLEKAENIDPKYKGLAVELAFSYNCLNQYDKAENILEEDIKTNSADAYVSKEYIYTLTKNKKIDKAIEQYNIAKKTIVDKQYDAENCYNILQYFYFQKDKENFNNWYKELSKLEIENKIMRDYVDKMKVDINK
ncbi:MAG: tetratricopeptide repeat protein [Flavobacteriales bacterium]